MPHIATVIAAVFAAVFAVVVDNDTVTVVVNDAFEAAVVVFIDDIALMAMVVVDYDADAFYYARESKRRRVFAASRKRIGNIWQNRGKHILITVGTIPQHPSSLRDPRIPIERRRKDRGAARKDRTATAHSRRMAAVCQ